MCARIADVMTEDVVSAENTTSLETVAERMLRHEIGSVVITNDDVPYGIVTETDVIHASYRTGKPLSEIATKSAASHPLVTVEPEQPVRLVVERMRDERVKKLVVVAGLEVRGIVTTHDLVDHYGELTRDVREIRENRERRTGSVSK
ncbi:CBS domain-containing protein [Natrarchaeobius oligotrophus]|uniref:CBS domain-containing protein n=1 Tax=Natrarchaeobius chitinivorans TaxID=1679083 RepID=A0A3N6PSL5_NATCH|nr:CBS domain-containing protein [Natrarchaeobius chitinivorans]RQH02536.1 CBS domain-containing protein [Natrarchaeobius chitinivorans]